MIGSAPARNSNYIYMGQFRAVVAKGFAYPAFDSISYHRFPHLARYRETQSSTWSLIGDHEENKYRGDDFDPLCKDASILTPFANPNRLRVTISPRDACVPPRVATGQCDDHQAYSFVPGTRVSWPSSFDSVERFSSS